MDHTTDIITGAITLQCAHCNATLQAEEKFCGYCGHEIDALEEAPARDVFSVIQPTLVYYFLTLVLLSIYKLTDVFPDGFEGLIIVTVIDVTIVIAFWGNYFRQLAPLFSLRNVKLPQMLLTILCAVGAALVVSVVAGFIDISLFDDVYYIYNYEDTANPLLWMVLLTCVQPAIFEEVAFRGFLFSNVQVLSSPKGAVYITAVLFAIIHLSFISLIWLVPLGIAFAMLRAKYNTLWYGMIAHFVYNFAVSVISL